MRGSVSGGFIRKQRRMNATEDHPRAAASRFAAEFIATTRISGMDTDPDHVSGSDGVEIDPVQRFVHDLRIAPATAGRGSQHVQPARRDDRDTERLRARVDQMDARHRAPGQSTDTAAEPSYQ